MYDLPPTLDCQDCGLALRELSPEEAQAMARNPYGYISYCIACQEYNLTQDLIDPAYRDD